MVPISSADVEAGHDGVERVEPPTHSRLPLMGTESFQEDISLPQLGADDAELEESVGVSPTQARSSVIYIATTGLFLGALIGLGILSGLVTWSKPAGVRTWTNTISDANRQHALSTGASFQHSSLQDDVIKEFPLFTKSLPIFSFERSPSMIIANDLWGIHDLLMVGYASVFMKRGSPGHHEVQGSAMKLARLIAKVHPYEPCRTAIRMALIDNGLGPQGIVKAAQASLSCLPAKFSEADIHSVFTEEFMLDPSKWTVAALPAPDTAKLGECAKTTWHRTCSYWVSFHTMAYRADGLGLGDEFLAALVPVIAGGATGCAGCTLHFRELYGLVLSKDVDDGLDESSLACPNHQCALAHYHSDKSKACLAAYEKGDNKWKSDDCVELKDEVLELHKFRNYTKRRMGHNASASAVLVATHNLVTETIPFKEIYGPHYQGKFYCVQNVLDMLPRNLAADSDKGSMPVECLASNCTADGVVGLSKTSPHLQCDITSTGV